MEQIALFLFAFLYVPTIYTDIRYRKIKNYITLPVIAMALTLIAWQHGVLTSVSFFAISLVLGLLPELTKIWGTGDTKLFVAASLCSILFLNMPSFVFILYFLAANVLMYLLVGHFFVLWKSKFNFVEYYARFKANNVVGGMAGTIPILISNILAILFLGVT